MSSKPNFLTFAEVSPSSVIEAVASHYDLICELLETSDVLPISISGMGLRGTKFKNAMSSVCDLVEGASVSAAFVVDHDQTVLEEDQSAGQLMIHRETKTPIILNSYFGCIIRRADYSVVKKIILDAASVALRPEPKPERLMEWTDKTRLLREDLEFFVAAKEWFASRRLAYSRGYLLYGPPGNGKTSSIRALARLFGLPVDTFDLKNNRSTDASFLDWMSGADRVRRDEGTGPKLVLKVLEDLDRFFPKNGKSETQVSLSAILNGLDGLDGRDGTIVVATANHPEDLDSEVIARPGRFDLRVEFTPPNQQQATKYLETLFERDDVTDAAIAHAVHTLQGQSFALHESLLAVAGTKASLRRASSINDADVAAALVSVTAGVELLRGNNKVGF